MVNNCDGELCPNWSGDGWTCPCAVFGLERPEFDLDPPEPERCEADYNPDGGYDGVCLAVLSARGECTRPGGRHDGETGLWVRDGETVEAAVARALREAGQ